MSEIEWTDAEREAVLRRLMHNISRYDCGFVPGSVASCSCDAQERAQRILAALAPFVAARERAAAAKALRDAEADYSHMYPSRARGVSAVAVVTCADLRDRANRIEQP